MILCGNVKCHTGRSHHGVPVTSGVPRAVFEACSARPPVGLPFQVLSETEPTHRFRDPWRVWRSVPPYDAPPKVPRDARLARRDPAAWAAVRALRTRTRPPHQPLRVSPDRPRKFGSASPLPPSRRPPRRAPSSARPRRGRGDAVNNPTSFLCQGLFPADDTSVNAEHDSAELVRARGRLVVRTPFS